MDKNGQLYVESPSFQDSFIDYENQQLSVKKSNESLRQLQPNDTFQAGYYTQSHPSFQEKHHFINQLTHKEQSYEQSEDEDVEEVQNNYDDNTRNYTIQYKQDENEADETYADCLPDNFFEQLKPQPRQFNINYNQNAEKQLERKSANGRSTSQKRMEQKNEELLYTRAAKQQLCQNLVQQQIDKEIKYMSNSKKMSQNSYRIVAKKLENEIQSKMIEIDPTHSKILTFSQMGRLLQLLNLFTIVKFDTNSQKENQEPMKKLRFAQETMFHQQFWFFVVNYINKDTVLGEIVFSTLRILMDPMQLTIKETKDFLAQYMSRSLVYLEEDRKVAQEKTQGFQLWTLDELIRAFRQLNEQKILREKSQNVNNQNNINKKQNNQKVLDKNVYTFKPAIDKNSQIIDEMHKKKFIMASNQLDITPIRNSNATHNTKSTQSTKKLINLLQSSQSNQNLHSQASLLHPHQQLHSNQQPGVMNIPVSIINPISGHLNHNSSTLSFLNNINNNNYNPASQYNINNPHLSQNESNLQTNVTSDYRNTTMNTDVTNNSIEQSHQISDKYHTLKQKSLMSQHQHPSRSNLNQSNQNFNTLQHTLNQNNGDYDYDEDSHNNPNFIKMKRCATLSSFQIPEEDYIDDMSCIPSNHFEKPIDRVNMMLQKKQQTQQKIIKLKEEINQQEMKECTFQPQIQRSVSPQYSAYSRNLKEQLQRQQFDINKRQQAKTQRNQLKQEQEAKELSECTFQPSLSPTTRIQNGMSKSPNKPNGFEQTVHRMRAAQDGQRLSGRTNDQGSYTTRASMQRTSTTRTSVSPKPDAQQQLQYYQQLQEVQPQKQQQLQNQKEKLFEQEQLIQQIQQQQMPAQQQQQQQEQYQNQQQLHQQQLQQYLQAQQQAQKQIQIEQKIPPKDLCQEDQNEQQVYVAQKPKIKPFFVLDIITPKGSKAFLELHKDDDIYEKAEQFSKQYQLDEITQSRIEQILDQQMQRFLQKRKNNQKND